MSKKREKNGKKPRGVGRRFSVDDPRPGPGRPSLTPTEKEVRELARLTTPDCIRRLDTLANGGGMTAVKSNEILLERAWGKPKQELDISSSTGGLVIMLPPLDPLE